MNDAPRTSAGVPPVLAPPVLVPPVLTPPPARVSYLRWAIHLGLLGPYPLVVGLLGWSRKQTYGPALGHTPAGLLRVCGLELVMFGSLFGLAWLVSRATREDLFWGRRGWKKHLAIAALGVPYSVALRLALALLVLLLATLLLAAGMSQDSLREVIKAKGPDVEALVDTAALQHNPVYFFLALTLVSFGVAGLREELWRAAVLAGLRKLWPGAFGSQLGGVAAAAAAAVIFGLGHISQGPMAVGLTALLGLGLGTIMVLHRSLWPAVVAHGMFDATSFALLPLATELLKTIR